jgi:integrase
VIAKTPDGTWRVRIFHKSKEVGGGHFKTRAEGLAWEASEKAKWKAGSTTDPTLHKTSTRTVADRYLLARKGTIGAKTWDSEESLLRCHMPEWLQAAPIASVTPAMLDRLWGQILSHRSLGTARRVRDVIVGLFAWSVRNGYTHGNPALQSKVPRGKGDAPPRRSSPFTARELAELIRTIREHNDNYADVVEFLSLTGLRWGELKSLRTSDLINDGLAYVIVQYSQSDGYEEGGTKSRRVRRLPLVDRALEIFQKHAASPAIGGRVFGNSAAALLSRANLVRDTHWEKVSGGKRLYDLRHTAATRWLRSGIDVHTVSVWLGHSQPTTTLAHYSHYMGGISDAAAMQRLAEVQLD